MTGNSQPVEVLREVPVACDLLKGVRVPVPPLMVGISWNVNLLVLGALPPQMLRDTSEILKKEHSPHGIGPEVLLDDHLRDPWLACCWGLVTSPELGVPEVPDNASILFPPTA